MFAVYAAVCAHTSQSLNGLQYNKKSFTQICQYFLLASTTEPHFRSSTLEPNKSLNGVLLFQMK